MLLSNAGLDSRQAEFHWGAYYSLDDSILRQRAVTLLKPPPGVNLSVTDGILFAQGNSPDAWFASLPAKASMIPGVREVNTAGLISASESEFQRLAGVIQSTVLTFPVGSAALAPAQSAPLKNLAPEIVTLFQKAQNLHKDVAVEVIGHSDSTGLESANEPLSKNRADAVARQLEREGSPGSFLRPVGVASARPLRPETDEEARQSNRSVTFTVSANAAPKS